MAARVEDVVAGRAEYPVKSKQFWQPDLAIVAPAVEAALRENFQSVSVGGAVVMQSDGHHLTEELPGESGAVPGPEGVRSAGGGAGGESRPPGGRRGTFQSRPGLQQQRTVPTGEDGAAGGPRPGQPCLGKFSQQLFNEGLERKHAILCCRERGRRVRPNYAATSESWCPVSWLAGRTGRWRPGWSR